MFEVEKGAFMEQCILAIHRYKCSCVCVVGCELRFAICFKRLSSLKDRNMGSFKYSDTFARTEHQSVITSCKFRNPERLIMFHFSLR